MDKHIYFIGIGGIGMSGIAQIFLRRGAKVSGSDIKETPLTDELKKLGARVFIGHDAGNIEGADIVVYSSAIQQDNPEVIAAKEKGLPLWKRAEALAELMKDKIGITVAGSHGKTTTTSLVSQLLLEAGLRPTVAIGGILKNIDTNASLGAGEFFIAEADESDGSFLYYEPKYSIITNIDYEHLDHYGNFDELLAAFREFIARTKDLGCVFACSDDKHLKKILSAYRKNCLYFGIEEPADIYPKNIEIDGLNCAFDCYFKNSFIGKFELALGGRHNLSNSLAAIALGLELGIDLSIIKRALAGYRGAGRRMEIKFQDEDYMIMDDYAHHPTEIKATLCALRHLKAQRVIAIFQPHRYTRTRLLSDEFARSFDAADYVIITDIYPANELPIDGVDAKLIYEKIKNNSKDKQAYYLPKEEITGHLLAGIRPGDLIITLGAGDIIKNNDELVERIKRQGKIRRAA